MRIEVITSEWDEGCRQSLELAMCRDTNAAMSLYFSDGEPEDATLARNFNGCYSIVDALRLAYHAGAAGETLEITEREEDEDD